MKKLLLAFLISYFSYLISASPATAHVTVKPSSVATAAYQVFSVGVPVEKDIPTTQLRVVIPEELQSVTPNVKPGWEIEIKKDSEGEEATVTEIIWSGGSIPAGQRDEFMFNAQAPTERGTLAWKAYQTYEDGSVVSWDQSPKNEHSHEKDASEAGPWSETNVVNDFPSSEQLSPKHDTAEDRLPLVLSVAALLLAASAVWMQARKRH